MLKFPLLYFKGMRLMMFQLSSFYYKGTSRCKRGLLDALGIYCSIVLVRKRQNSRGTISFIGTTLRIPSPAPP